MAVTSSQIVVDTSCVLAVAMNEVNAAAILRMTVGTELFAPTTLPVELCNALSKMIRRKRLQLAEAVAVMETVDRMSIELVDVSMVRSLTIAAKLGIYAYDAYVIQCAENVSCPVLTLDSGLANAVKTAGLAVLEVEQ